MTTARLLRTPSTRRAGGIEKRRSASQSSTITCSFESSAAPAWESRAAEARVGADDAVLEAGAQAEPAPVAADLPDAGGLTPSISVISETASLISRSGSPSFSA